MIYILILLILIFIEIFVYIFKNITEAIKFKCIRSFPNVHNGIIIFYPHTSNWDGFLTWFIMYKEKMLDKINILGKSTLIPKFLHKHFENIGFIPIYRNQAQKLDFKKIKSRPFLILSPEGTRKKTDNWNDGFYFMAKQNNIPLIMLKYNYEIDYSPH